MAGVAADPLKPTTGMAPYPERLASARESASDRRIRVSEAEAELGTRYTVDTLRGLCVRYPRHRFVWIMGADNLIQVTEWRQWNDIFRAVPVAVSTAPPILFGHWPAPPRHAMPATG